MEMALESLDGVLNHINESIREQEGRERLKAISHDLWVGQGCVLPYNVDGSSNYAIAGDWI